MAYPKDSTAAFSGASGQTAVVAELLQRKCNAAIPLVDLGTDVFAFKDNSEEVARIQVKADKAKPYTKGSGYSARFGVPLKQLSHNDDPKLFYAFAVRLNGLWVNYVVIGRTDLKLKWDQGCGSVNKKSKNLELHIQFRLEIIKGQSVMKAKCGTFDLTVYLNAWGSLPPLKEAVPIDANAPQA